MCAGRRGLAAHAAAASVLLVPAGAQMLYTEFFIREPDVFTVRTAALRCPRPPPAATEESCPSGGATAMWLDL